MLPIEEGLMTSVNEAVIRYIAAWNECDPERRHDLVTRTWTEDGTYTDLHRQAVGHDGIDAMLARTQDQFPGYRDVPVPSRVILRSLNTANKSRERNDEG